MVPAAFANIYIIWGITFLAISFGLKGFPPFLLAALRFLLAGLLILTYLVVKGERPNVPANWRKNAVAGILVLTGGTGLVGWGEQYVTASEAAIAIATGPFWFIAIDRKNWKFYFSDKLIIIGLLTGFAGLALFLGGSVHPVPSRIHSTSVRITAFVVLALSSIAWVLGSLYSKNKPAGHSTFMNIAQQLICAGTAALIIALARNEMRDFSFAHVPAMAWLGLAFLVFCGSIIAYLSYIWLLSVRPAALVSTHTYINPIVTVFAVWIYTGEMMNGRQLAGLFVILFGVLLTNANKYFQLNDRSRVKIRRVLRVLNRIARPYKRLAPFP